MIDYASEYSTKHIDTRTSSSSYKKSHGKGNHYYQKHEDSSQNPMDHQNSLKKKRHVNRHNSQEYALSNSKKINNSQNSKTGFLWNVGNNMKCAQLSKHDEVNVNDFYQLSTRHAKFSKPNKAFKATYELKDKQKKLKRG